MAASLMGRPAAFVNADVALDGEPVIGSFTVDGLTFAVTEGSDVELVGVVEAEGAFGSEVPTSPQPPSASAPEAEGLASEVDGSALLLPGSVAYGDAEYSVASIGAYAFYLSGVTSVELPASVTDVDERAFRSSDVSSVEVAENNPAYSSFDGVLYDADYSSLLLIPEGRLGAVRMPSTTVAALPSAFSHCAGVDAIMVDADGAAFASENGLLYDASLATLLRVPAGATDITIREGCTTIAAGAMEGCAKLSTITAPASVTSISPDVFTSVPTVSLPAASLAEDVSQISAMVALSTVADSCPEIDPSSITVNLPGNDSCVFWSVFGFAMETIKTQNDSEAALQAAYAYAAFNVGEPRWYTPAQPISVEMARSNWYKYDADGNNIFALHTEGKTDSVVKYGWLSSTTLKFFLADGSYYLSYPTGWSLNRGCAVSGGTHWICPNLPQVDSGTLVISSECFEHQHPGSTITWDAQGGDCNPASAQVLYGGNIAAPLPQREGYTFDGWYTSPRGGGYVCGDANSGGNTGEVYQDAVFYAQYTPHTYIVSFDSRGGSGISSINATFDEEIELPALTRQGYVFQGWKDESAGSVYAAGKTKNLTAVDKAVVKLTAQWSLVISATVPTDVEARVDVLGLEEQQEAAGYIESRCGEPLTVASIELSPLAGASELFGADNVADVALEVLAAGATSPDARFALNASASQAPTTSAAFRMASYGARVPIAYRFDIPDELLPSLVETTKPVCQVAYTVALA